jgi:hypothetical protein
MSMRSSWITIPAVLLLVAVTAVMADAQVYSVYRPSGVVYGPAPVVAYRPAPVVAYRPAPVVAYRPAPVVAYRPAPVVAYRPAPVVAYRPVVAVPPPVPVGVVVGRPVVVSTKVYGPGQPVRNLLRAITP